MGKFTNKVILVTGAGKGIGRATALAFSREGAKLVLVSRTLSELKETQGLLNTTEVLLFDRDISVEANVQEIFAKTQAKFGPIEVVINNAAVLRNRKLAELSAKDWDEVMAINVRSIFLTAKELFKSCNLNRTAGAMVNISSLAGIRGTEKFPGFSSYVASKFAVVGLTESLAVEGKEFGVRVNCIAPGAVDTALLKREAPHLKTQTLPEDIAKAILFLADDSSSGRVSGSTLEIYSNQ